MGPADISRRTVASVSRLGPRGATHALILAFVLLHLLVAASLPLITFETHYALYGRHLDWSYLDHPPMVGWLQGLVQFFSHSDFAMRLAPTAILAASQYLLALLALRLFPAASPWLGFYSVLLLQGAVIMHLGFAMAPEIPLLLSGLLVLWFTLRIIEDDRTRDWVGLGLALGVAALSKYTAITLAFSVLLALWGNRRLASLFSPRGWLAIGLAALLVSPVLLWNLTHDWASFRFQLGYQLDGDEASAGWSLAGALNKQLEQLGAYSPALYFGGIAAAFHGLRQPGNGRLLLVFALPIFGLFVWMSGAGRSSAHWTLLAWTFMAPSSALWLANFWHLFAVRLLVYGSAGLSLVALVLALILMLPFIPFADYRHPLNRILGWQEAAARAQALRQQMAAEGGKEPVLLVSNWHYAGPLAWYEPGAVVQNTEAEPSQYPFWDGEVNADTRGILVVFDEEDEQVGLREPGFQCRQVDSMPVSRGPTRVRTFFFYRCEPDAGEGH